MIKKIILNDIIEKEPINSDYHLVPEEKYEINLDVEMDFQVAILAAFNTMDFPPAIKNYHYWLHKNNFNVEMPNPSNEVVACYYGKKPLWNTEYSQGIVVKAENEKDFFIVMECSKKNRGFKHTKIILTPLGCI